MRTYDYVRAFCSTMEFLKRAERDGMLAKYPQDFNYERARIVWALRGIRSSFKAKRFGV